MRDWLAQQLKPLADWLLALVLKVPLPAVRLIFLGLLAALAVWALTLPPQRPEGEAGKNSTILSDLRLFAVGLLLLQSIFYLIF